jgi:hypothetical protein
MVTIFSALFFQCFNIIRRKLDKYLNFITNFVLTRTTKVAGGSKFSREQEGQKIRKDEK